MTPDERTERLHTLIEELAAEALVTGWTLICTGIDRDDGRQLVWTDTMPNQSASTSLGHAMSLVAVEASNIVRNFETDDD